MKRIALIREGKRPFDRRVALSPDQCRTLLETYPQVQLVVQKSPVRCFPDSEYTAIGIPAQDQVNECDVFLGIKEVPVDELIPDKTYLFFSHTVKKQSYNRKLLQEILHRNIRLIDYEKLTDEEGNRLVAFGHWAGIVGAYNAIWAWGKRFNLFDLRRAYFCFDLEDMKTEYNKVKLPPIKIALTGNGRVARGAMEVLDGMGIRKVSPEEYTAGEFAEAVYTQLRSKDYHFRRTDGGFDAEEFYSNPSLYDSGFPKFTRHTDLLIATAYWNPQASVLFSKEDINRKDFRIKVIADVTCDIGGSIPTTVKASTVLDPLYDYNPNSGTTEDPLSDEGNITIMAIDNLPSELPRDASESFGNKLLEHVFPYLLGEDSRGIIQRATIAENGQLTAPYQYLQGFVEERG